MKRVETNCARLRGQLQLWIDSGELEQALPELAALRGVPQHADYHTEGDAYTHTLLAVAALSEDDDERVFWAVLLHDIGKAAATRMVDGCWRAYGHDQLGAAMARQVLLRFDRESISDDVVWLIRHHHFALSWGPEVEHGLSRRQQRFCMHPLFPLLCKVCRTDAAASHGISSKGVLLEWIEQHAATVPG